MRELLEKIVYKNNFDHILPTDKKRNADFSTFLLNSWCGIEDLNFHDLKTGHKILSLARLPIPPIPLVYYFYIIHLFFSFVKFFIKPWTKIVCYVLLLDFGRSLLDFLKSQQLLPYP